MSAEENAVLFTLGSLKTYTGSSNLNKLANGASGEGPLKFGQTMTKPKESHTSCPGFLEKWLHPGFSLSLPHPSVTAQDKMQSHNRCWMSHLPRDFFMHVSLGSPRQNVTLFTLHVVSQHVVGLDWITDNNPNQKKCLEQPVSKSESW